MAELFGTAKLAHDRLADPRRGVGVEGEKRPCLVALQRPQQPLFDERVEGDDGEVTVAGVRRADRRAQRLTHGLDQQLGIAGQTRTLADDLEDPRQIPDRNLFGEQTHEYLLGLGEAHPRGHQVLDHGAVGRADQVDEGLDILAAQQLGGVLASHLGQMGRDHRRTVDDGGAHRFGHRPQLWPHPLRWKPEDGFEHFHTGEHAEVVGDHEKLARRGDPSRHFHPVNPYHVGPEVELDVVTRPHRRNDDAQFLDELSTKRLHPVQQVAVRPGIDEVDQVDRQLQPDRFNAQCPGQFGRRVRIGLLFEVGRSLGGRPVRCIGSGGHPARQNNQQPSDDEERQGRQPGHQAHGDEGDATDQQRLMLTGELRHHIATEVAAARCSGDDQTRGNRHQQCRDLRHEAVADGEQRVGAHRIADVHALLEHADQQSADEVDRGDDHRGDGVALDELRRTVHRAVEVGLPGDILAPSPRLVVVDDPGVEVGVDRHLLAGHRVEGEPGGDLGNAGGTVGDDDELDDHQDEEHDEADDE